MFNIGIFDMDWVVTALLYGRLAVEDNTHAQYPGKSLAHVIKRKLQYVMQPNALVVPTGVFQQAESKSRIQAYKHINFKSQKYLKVR